MNAVDRIASHDVFAETLAEMTWPEVEESARNGAVVLWAFGVIEEHGPHLPCGTDVYRPMAWIRAVRENLREHDVEAVIMPPYYWGVNIACSNFPGTYSVRSELTQQVVVELVTGLALDGFRHVFFFSGHGNALHNRTVHTAATLATQICGIDVSFVASSDLVGRIGLRTADAQLTIYKPAATHDQGSTYADVHAGDSETSQMMAVCPELVREDVRVGLAPTQHGPEAVALWRHGHFEARRLTPLGYLGDPARATAERGAHSLAEDSNTAATAILERLARLAPGHPQPR